MSAAGAALRVRDLVELLDGRYPPQWAEPWDAVGLVCGDPADRAERLLFTVDVTAEVVQQAIDGGFDAVVAHHPLWLKGTSTVAASTVKGRAVSRLIRAGCALFVAHTNADVAFPGVSDALAAALGLLDPEPLVPQAEALDKLVVFVPVEAAERLLDALAAAGAGRLGNYEGCAWETSGTGTFRPLPGANPAVGSVGETVRVAEVRLETVLPRGRRRDVLAALRAAHPYEEPAFDLLELAPLPGPRGLGRVGRLPGPVPLGELVRRAAEALPATASGIRATGDPARPVSTVAVCGGSGDSLLAAAAARADAFLTADLRHHPAAEAPEGLALLDAAHWATEWPWLAEAAGCLRSAAKVDTVVSDICTDPWTTSLRSPQL